MIDYLKAEQKDILVYAVQQTFQKSYEYQEGDEFNTYFSLTNFSQQKELQIKSKLDKVIVLNPYFFDCQITQQINLVECVQKLVQNYFIDSQNRLAILSLSSSDQEIENCFLQQPLDQITNLELQQDIEFTSFKNPYNVINQIKNILQKTRQFQRDDAILSLTFISPDNFDYTKLSKEELKQIIKQELSVNNQISHSNGKVSLNCMSIGTFDNFLLQQMCETMPQSIYSFSENKDFVKKFKDIIISIQSIFMTDVETTLTFKSDSKLVDYQILEQPNNWIQQNEYTYKFSYPFFYKFQELNHLFKLKIKFKGSLSEQIMQETIGLNRSTFTYNNQKYFYERPITIDLVQQTQEIVNYENSFNLKCQIAFLRQKYVIPFLQKYIENFEENKEQSVEILNSCLEQINQLDQKQSFILLFSQQVLNKINKFLQKTQVDEKEKRKLDTKIKEALAILQNQLYPIHIYLKIKKKL